MNDEIWLSIGRPNKIINDTGIENFELAEFRITVNSITDSALVRVEHYWVAPDEVMFNDFAYQLSTDRYWRVDGLLFDNLDANARISFDGREQSSGYTDLELMQDVNGVQFNEDSLVLMYRPDQKADWTPWPDIDINTLGSSTDKFGRVEFDGLLKGEYTLAWRKSSVGIEETLKEKSMKVYPNPSSSEITVELADGIDLKDLEMRLLDLNGKVISSQNSARIFRIDLSGNSAGTYLLELRSNGLIIETQQVVFNPR